MKKGKVYRLAMSIGGENRVGWLRKTSLAKLGRMHGYDPNVLADRVNVLADRVMDNIEPAVNDFASCEGADKLASLLVPRVRALCKAAKRNVRVDGVQFKPCDVSRITCSSAR